MNIKLTELEKFGEQVDKFLKENSPWKVEDLIILAAGVVEMIFNPIEEEKKDACIQLMIEAFNRRFIGDNNEQG